MKLKVALNGTSANPYHVHGLTQNPFPQVARYERTGHCLRLQKLGGDPIPHDRAEQYIRETLVGWDEEFIKLCVSQFKPGELVKFEVVFNEDQ